MEQHGKAQLRISAVVRVIAAVLIAAGVAAVAIVATWGPLDVRTDIVGYPIFHDFNVENYFTAYYLVIGFFPIAALLLFLGLTRIGPRLGLAVPPPRGSLRPRSAASVSRPPLEGEPPLATSPPSLRQLVVGARIAFVGAVLGLEIGVAGDAIWRGLAIGLAGYAAAVILAAVALDHWGRREWSLEQRLAAVNSLGAPFCIAGLIAVSANTEVRILADGSVEHFPWFPAWLGVPMVAGLVAWIATALRRANPAAIAGIERRALVLVAAPVCVVVLLGGLVGDIGAIDFFHYGEVLVGSKLVGDGWMPWRDLVLTHGLLQDVVGPGLSTAVFGESFWAYAAGTSLLLPTLYFVAFYLLFAYLFGRNWLFLLFTVLLVLGTQLVPLLHFRFILWPLILILLAAVLDKPTRLRAAGLALLSVGQLILTPETAPALLAVAVVLAAYELYNHDQGASLAVRFSRTLWFTVAAVVFAATFAAYLASRGALDDFVYLSVDLVKGHSLTGGKPPTLFGVSDTLYRFMAFAPIAALLIAFAYAVVRLRLRLRFSTEDWVIGAVALCALLYYPKFLARMDFGHLTQAYSVALPLMLFVVYRAVAAVESAVRASGAGRAAARVTAHPVSLLLVVLVAVLGWNRISDRFTSAPSAYRAEVLDRPQFKRVGYAVEPFDPVMHRDLKRVIDAYLAPKDSIFDFTNAPALFHYLIDREPSTRYFHATLALRASTQEDLIDRLSRARPKLIVFDSFVVGLPNWDGVPTTVRLYDVSRWILDHYRPLLTTHQTTIYARRDQPPSSKVSGDLTEEPIVRDPEFRTQLCDWRYAPNFLSGAAEPPSGAQSVSARIGAPRRQVVTVHGWAGDALAQLPAREVIATLGGTVVGRSRPDVRRPELGATAGFIDSGFDLTIPVAEMRRTADGGRLKVYAVARDGAVSELLHGGGTPGAKTAQLGRRTVRLDPGAIQGSIDRVRRAASIQIALPPGSRWSEYRWLELEPGRRGFRRGVYWLYDRADKGDPKREVSFRTLDDSPHRFRVPVSSCPQWHGYGSGPLLLSMHPHQNIAAARLIR